MHRLTALSLLCSFSLLTACGPAPLDAETPQTEAERISRLEEQISNLTTALENSASSSAEPASSAAAAPPEGSQTVTQLHRLKAVRPLHSCTLNPALCA